MTLRHIVFHICGLQKGSEVLENPNCMTSTKQYSRIDDTEISLFGKEEKMYQ